MGDVQIGARGRAAPAVTVVVCSRDRPEHLRVALPLIRATLRAGDQLVVVDSASIGVATSATGAAFGDLVREEVPGLARARNAGIRACQREVVAFTDDDCRPEPDWVERISAAFAVEQVAFVTGRVTAMAGFGGNASVTWETEGRTFRRGDDPSAAGHGANMAFRVEALRRIGGFDETLGAGTRLRSGDDKDIVLRLLEAGYEGVFDPRAVIGHVQWRSHTELVHLRFGYGLGSGAFRAKAACRHRREGMRLLGAGLRDDIVGLRHAVRHPNRGIFSLVSHLGGYVIGAAIVFLERGRRGGPP